MRVTHHIRTWALRALLVVIGVGVAVLIALPFLPDILKHNRQDYINIDLGTVEYTVGDGDIFAAQYGSVAPPSNPHEVLSRHELAWDADGFRVPALPADRYRIITLGDSYTEAAGVARPWSDELATLRDEPVRNMGYRGYSPQDYVTVMREYGVQEQPEIVIVGFFGGNDIHYAEDETNGFVLPEIARAAMSRLSPTAEPWNSQRERYQYPVYLTLGEARMPVAFINSYVTWLNLSQADLRQSQNLAAVTQAWQEIIALAGDDACVVLTYFPSKPQIYLPYIQDQDRVRITDGQTDVVLQADGTLGYGSAEPTFDQLLERRHHSATVLAEVAAQENWHFFDLSPAFTRAADEGQLLWLAYDSHWNQAGHDLAAATINAYIDATCP